MLGGTGLQRETQGSYCCPVFIKHSFSVQRWDSKSNSSRGMRWKKQHMGFSGCMCGIAAVRTSQSLLLSIVLRLQQCVSEETWMRTGRTSDFPPELSEKDQNKSLLSIKPAWPRFGRWLRFVSACRVRVTALYIVKHRSKRAYYALCVCVWKGSWLLAVKLTSFLYSHHGCGSLTNT